MNYVDYIILLFLVIAFLLGYKDGLIRKLIGFIGFAAGVYLSFKFSREAGELIAPIFNDDLYLSEIVAGLLIFLLTILVVAILKRVIHPVDKVNRFVNRILGGVAGSIQAIFFISAFLLFLKIFNFPSEIERKSSLLYRNVYVIIPSLVEYIVGTDTDKREFIKELIEKKGTDSLNIDRYIQKEKQND